MTRNPVYCVLYCLFLTFAVSCGESQETNSKLDSFFDKFEEKRLKITSFDGVRIGAKLFEPKARHFPGPRPAMIFANSWAFNEEEYDGQAEQLAKKGYIVLSYAARGFGTSEGVISTGGAEDLEDVSTLIDWLEANTALDSRKIAMGGVSYGGGLSLLAAAHEPRIKTAISMSGWGDLEQAMYGQETVREVWLKILLISGRLFGRMDPTLTRYIENLRRNENIDEVRAWATQRSPLTYVDKLNERQVPIFIANSYQDNLFPPNQIRPFYEKLTGPKLIYLDPGIHTSSAMGGLAGMPSAVWSEAQRWLDYWLRDIETGILNQSPVSFQVRQSREYFSKFPSLMSKTAEYQLTPLNDLSDFLEDEALPQPAEDRAGSTISLDGGYDSGATSGFPLISDTVEAILSRPVMKHVSRIDKRYAAVYKSRQVNRLARMRGAPVVEVFLEAHKTPLQVVAYLYDVDENGMGTLVGHGVYSRREGKAQPSSIQVQIATTAYDFAKDHTLVVALDTRDPLYENPSTAQYNLAFKHADPEATAIQLPLLAN